MTQDDNDKTNTNAVSNEAFFSPDQSAAVNMPETEARIQATCFQWFHNSYPQLRGLLYHVPNGEKRDPITAAKLKASGVVKGVPDLEFHFWKRTFFLECKTPEGRLSPEQIKMKALLEQHGFLFWVFRSLDEFQQIILSIIEDKSLYYQRGMSKNDYMYRHGVFSYLYNLPEGQVQYIEAITEPETREKFKGLCIEFMTDTYDRQAGFELLFTPDYKAFYKNSLTAETSIVFEGFSTIEIPPHEDR